MYTLTKHFLASCRAFDTRKSFCMLLTDVQACLNEALLSLQVSNILKYLFPVPKEDSKRVITFSNQEDFISFRSTFTLNLTI